MGMLGFGLDQGRGRWVSGVGAFIGYNIYMQGTDHKLILGSLLGIVFAASGGAALYRYLSQQPANHQIKERDQIDQEPKKTIALIGDVGGTNARYKLIEITGSSYQDSHVINEGKFKVANYDHFYLTIDEFIKQKGVHPKVCVIAIAGPVDKNSILMSNVQKWGRLDGEELGKQLKIEKFVFINDFEANAYALMTLKDGDVEKLNGLDPIDTQHKFIIGPGTGLGTASLIAVPRVNSKNDNFVVPGEGGHIGFAPSNQEQAEFYAFLQKEYKQDFLVRERCFCGPEIPFMFNFFAQKHPNEQAAMTHPTAEDIIKIGIQNENSLHRKAVKLFLDIYGNVVCDQLLRKLCYGGLYLVGSITLSVLPLLLSPQFKWLDSYKSKRPYLSHVFQKVPILAIKQVYLGYRGAFIYAQKLINQ